MDQEIKELNDKAEKYSQIIIKAKSSKKYLIFVSPTWSKPEKSRDCTTSGTGDPNLVIRHSKFMLS